MLTMSSKPLSTPKSVADFTILPLTLPSLPSLPAQYQHATHYIYVKPHSSSVPAVDDDRSLFIANVPIDATENSIRALFVEQLGGAMVERVDFDSAVPARVGRKRGRGEMDDSGDGNDDEAGKTQGKKRKRSLIEDQDMLAYGVVEDAETALPQLWGSELHRSGSGAVVVFVDKKSAQGAWKRIGKAVKEEKSISWRGGDGVMGVNRYTTHQNLTYPLPSLLQSRINTYLTQFSTLEARLTRSRKAARSVPDSDGFITVTRGSGSRTGPARLEDAQKKKLELEERRKKNGPKEDFYRFQNRERRKEEEGRLRRRFEEDRERVRGMRERREKKGRGKDS